VHRPNSWCSNEEQISVYKYDDKDPRKAGYETSAESDVCGRHLVWNMEIDGVEGRRQLSALYACNSLHKQARSARVSPARYRLGKTGLDNRKVGVVHPWWS
jgi:hypothetical protein